MIHHNDKMYCNINSTTLAFYDIPNNKLKDLKVKIPKNSCIMNMSTQDPKADPNLRVFVIGGATAAGEKTVSEYLIKEEKLVLKEPMKYSRYVPTVSALSYESFIVIGGYNTGGTCEEYDLNNN